MTVGESHSLELALERRRITQFVLRKYASPNYVALVARLAIRADERTSLRSETVRENYEVETSIASVVERDVDEIPGIMNAGDTESGSVVGIGDE